MNYKNLFYFDIETVSSHKELSELDNRRKKLFIRKIERKSDRFNDWKLDPDIVYKEKAPLIPEFGKIVCVSMAYFKGDDVKIKSVFGDNEEDIIKEVHNIFKSMSDRTTMGLCGYYIKGFDIPWLSKKMMRYDLDIPQLLKTHNVKPWDMNVYDLAEIWRCNGTLETSSFDEMLCELDIESPKSDISGKDVNEVYWNGEIERIKDYCENDVKASVESAKKLGPLV